MFTVPKPFHHAVMLLALAACFPASAQQPSAATDSAAQPPSYAAIATLVLRSPLILDATVRDTVRLTGADAAGAAPGTQRLYVTADVAALIRGSSGGVPPRVGYIVDAPLGTDGRAPRLKKIRVLLFARPAPTSGQVQLTGPDSQQAWTPALDATVRAIAREALAADAPPVVTGIGNAFHVPGALPGEGETQIFLTTADHRPVSLSILRRPGEQPRWSVALSEITDDAAQPPARDTLLWYRLACFLPSELPEQSVASQDPTNAASAREDYGFVIQSLGRCDTPQTPVTAVSGGAVPG